MKNYHAILLFNIFSLLFFSSCHQNKENIVVNGISVDIDNMNKVSTSDIFTKVEIIRLETSELSLIKSIDKLLIYKNNYYIFDSGMQQVLAFDKNGQSVFSINNHGKGPDEYLRISDFDVYENKLSLVSTIDGTIHIYDLKGNFIERYRLPKIEGAYRFIKHLKSDTIVFWTSDYQNKLKFYSHVEKKIFKELMPEPFGNIFYNLSTPVFPFENYIVRSFDNHIMQMLPDGSLTLAYQWDFGTLNNEMIDMKEVPNPNEVDKLHEFARKIYSSEVVNYFFGMAGGNSQYINTQIHRKNKNINIFYNKINSTKYVFEKTVENAALFPVYWAEDYMIGIIPEIDYIDINDVIPDKILDDKNIKIKAQINQFDNPILIKYHFKK